MDVPIQFVSGMPRTGSTLLLNLLGQNPNHHVTSTCDLIELFAIVQQAWPNQKSFQTWGLESVKPFARNCLRGMLYGFYLDQIERGQTVFDKSRGWLQYIEDLEAVLDRGVKIITTIRDVRSILASFEILYRNRDVDWRYSRGEVYWKAQTLVGRSELLLNDEGVVGMAINRVRDALERCPKKLHFVSYDALCSDPLHELKKIHKELHLPHDFDKYNPNKVKQITHEDDTYHGMDLHTVGPKVRAPAKKERWEGILPEDYAKSIASRYSDINNLARI